MSQRKTAKARRREQVRRAQERQQNIRRLVLGLTVALLLLAAGYVLLNVLAPDEQEVPEVTQGNEFEDTAIDGDRPLADMAPQARAGYYSSYPEMVIDPTNDYEAVIQTENGDMRVRLFAEEAPLTVNNFVFLANQGFYDGVTFHRVIEDFMAQAGDPSGTGAGGPGYQFQDETDNGLTFDEPGLLAMANAGPNTNGSQFFITFAPTPWLDGRHTIFGEVVEGEEVLSQLTRRQPGAATPGDVIERIEIYEAES